MKKILALSAAAMLLISGCKKADNNTPTQDQATLEGEVLTDFVGRVAKPQYADLAAKSDGLYTAVQALQAAPTEANLAAARTAWLDVRGVWEQCEGFLFGPVEDGYYDPAMDTWPTDYVQMDSLLKSSASLKFADMQGITLSLRGFHPIEYILFGNHGDRKAAGITARQEEYLTALATDLRSNCHALSDAWDGAKGGYGSLVTTAGKGSSKYATRREVFTALADGLIEICEEVGEGKMEEPLAAQDPAKVESPYSGNSVADFRNNIVGLRNVYLGRYTTDGRGMNELVAMGNAALDNKLQSQMTSAIASFDAITMPFEEAIFSQRPQIRQTQAALAALKATLEEELKPYLLRTIKD